MEPQTNSSATTGTAGSPMATIQIDGQQINVPVEIALDDEQLVRTLVVFFPDAANAQIERSNEKDGNLLVKVTKRAGSKGTVKNLCSEQLSAQADPIGSVLKVLSNCEEQINPAIVMHERIRQAEVDGLLTIQEKLLMNVEVDGAIKEGQDWKKMVDHTLERLRLSQAVASKQVPVGF